MPHGRRLSIGRAIVRLRDSDSSAESASANGSDSSSSASDAESPLRTEDDEAWLEEDVPEGGPDREDGNFDGFLDSDDIYVGPGLTRAYS
jgi:hypothetical protein